MFYSRRRDHDILAALDVGASKVACFIARVTREPGLAPQAEIIGVGRHGAPVKTRTQESADQLEHNIRKAVAAAERMAGLRIERVAIAAPGRALQTRRIGVDLDLPEGVVTQEDVSDCLEEGARLTAPSDCRALHALPIAYKLDGEEFSGDPVGYSAQTLTTQMLGVSLRERRLHNLTILAERCGLAADGFVAAPMAAGEAVLIEDEKDLGVLLMDIGATSTNFSVYENGALVHCGGAALGGAHITKDIAQIFGTPLAQAERIKTLYGAALIGPGDEHRSIEFPQLGDAGVYARASRADLCEVIIPRMEEIFELVEARLPDAQGRKTALRRAVITGGGSLLVGAREIAEKMLSMKTRLGRPMMLAGAPEAASAPGFAVCAGIIQSFINSEEDGRLPIGLPRQSLHSFHSKSVFGGARQWLRQKF